jgi:alkyl sulfatase BDS1-like metallo-beta-lactamase superfamily hydrolase
MAAGGVTGPCRVAALATLLVAGLVAAGCAERKPAEKEGAAAGTADDASLLAPKPASAATIAANKKVLESLPFNDKQDFEDAQRGLIEAPATLTIKNEKGNVVWDLELYKQYIGLDKEAPDTVNPSLWRNAQLNMQYGLFKVTDRIYQVRGYDLSNITFVQGNTGWIVGDPLISAETARAAYELVTKNLGKKPVVAVIYSHSHVDHYGGVRGLVDEGTGGRTRSMNSSACSTRSTSGSTSSRRNNPRGGARGTAPPARCGVA